MVKKFKVENGYRGKLSKLCTNDDCQLGSTSSLVMLINAALLYSNIPAL